MIIIHWADNRLYKIVQKSTKYIIGSFNIPELFNSVRILSFCRCLFLIVFYSTNSGVSMPSLIQKIHTFIPLNQEEQFFHLQWMRGKIIFLQNAFSFIHQLNKPIYKNTCQKPRYLQIQYSKVQENIQAAWHILKRNIHINLWNVVGIYMSEIFAKILTHKPFFSTKKFKQKCLWSKHRNNTDAKMLSNLVL